VRWRDVMLLFGRAAACRSPYPHKRPKKVFRAGFLSDGTNIPEIHPLGDALRERRMGAKGHEERLPAAKAECRLWVQKGDDRRNAPQRAKRADFRPSCPRGTGRFDPKVWCDRASKKLC